MLLLKYALLAASGGLSIAAAVVLILDLHAAFHIRRSRPQEPEKSSVPRRVRWQQAGKLAALAWLPLLPDLGMVIVPSGAARALADKIIAAMGPLEHFELTFRNLASLDPEQAAEAWKAVEDEFRSCGIRFEKLSLIQSYCRVENGCITVHAQHEQVDGAGSLDFERTAAALQLESKTPY